MNTNRIIASLSVLCITLLVLLLLTPVGVSGETTNKTGTVTQTESIDHRINSISKFDYLNSRGFEDSNNDGTITIQIDETLNMTKSRDPTLKFDGNKPIVLQGSGGFTNIPAPLISKIPSGHSLTIESLHFTDAHGGGPDKKIIHVGGSVTLREVKIANTVHMATYPGETFAEKHRVGGVRAAESLRIYNSTIKTVAQAASTGGELRIISSKFKNISSTLQGGVQSGSQAIITDTTIIDSSGTRGGAIKAQTARLDNVTLKNVQAGLGGGGIKTEGNLELVDSEIRNAEARRNGGAINADGDVNIRESTIVNAESDQGYSIYAYGLHSLTVESSNIRNSDPIQFGYGGINEGSISVLNSELHSISRLQASKITIDDSNINDELSLKGLYFTIEDSKLSNIRGMNGLEVSLSNSIIQGSGKIDGGDSVTVQDSYLLEFPGFRTEDLTLSNVTFYKSGENVILSPHRRSLSEINFIEATTPVFDGKLPDRSNVFIDTRDDTESYGQWDADLFWSRNGTFPAANQLPVEINSTPIAKDQLDLQVENTTVIAGKDAIIKFNMTNTASQSIQSPNVSMGSIPKGWRVENIRSTDGSFDNSNNTLSYQEVAAGETKTGSVILSTGQDTTGNYSIETEGQVNDTIIDTDIAVITVKKHSQQSDGSDTADEQTPEDEETPQRKQAYDVVLGFDSVEFINEKTLKANIYIINRDDNQLNDPTVKITPPDGMQITEPTGNQPVAGTSAHNWTLSAIEPSAQRELTITMEKTTEEISSDAEIEAELLIADESVISTTAEYQGPKNTSVSDLPISADDAPGFGFLPAVIGLVTTLFIIRAKV